MDANRLYIATIDANAAALARDLGLGLELDEFCMASNMDGKAFAHWDAVARRASRLYPSPHPPSSLCRAIPRRH